MNISRQEALLIVAVLALIGMALLVSRLLRVRRHGISIRMQIFLALMIVTTMLNAAFAMIVIDRFVARAVLFAHRAAQDDVQLVAQLAARSVETLGLSLKQGARILEVTRLFSSTTSASETRVQLLDPQGRLLFDSHGEWTDASALKKRPEVKEAMAGRIDQIARYLRPNRVAAAAPIRNGSRQIGIARVEKTTVGMKSLMADIAPKVALLAFFLAVAAALAAFIIGQAVARPLERLTLTAKRIAQGEHQAALPSPHGREIRALTSAFEQMRAELEERHAVETLATDLSHELKNPVASIFAAAEVIQEAPEDVASVQRFATRIQESATKLNALLSDLLILARTRAQGVGESPQRLDLASLAKQSIEQLAPQAAQRRVGIELSTQSKCPIRGHEKNLRRAIENLLSNAISFSPEGAKVKVSIEREENFWVLTVKDEGPGVSPSVREHLFQRFISTRQDQGGTGLGLAIVQAIAEAHGGTAELRDTQPSGSTFALRLPA